MDQLRAITTFIRAAQSGSISEAARTLGLTPQAASKHIQNLEQWAGVRLLNRTTHKISLTEEGLAFYERCKPAVESIEEGLIALRDVTDDNGPFQARLAEAPGNSYSYALALVAGVVAIGVALIIRFSPERRGGLMTVADPAPA